MEKRPRMLNERRFDLSETVALLIFCLLVVLLVAELLFGRNFFVVEVDGESMLDTLLDGDYLYASFTAQAERGDIVVVDVSDLPLFAHREKPYLLIKRLIAEEGDTVKCEKGTVYLKKAGESEFSALGEEYVSPEYFTGDFKPVTVGEGEIFVLGDHRNDSTDSREIGCIKRDHIRGVVPAWAVAYKSLITAWEQFRN